MSRNKMIYILVALALLIAAGPTIGSLIATRAAASTSALSNTTDAVNTAWSGRGTYEPYLPQVASEANWSGRGTYEPYLPQSASTAKPYIQHR